MIFKKIIEGFRRAFTPQDTSYYFVATVHEEEETTSDGRKYMSHDSRCVGFFRNLKDAISSIENNDCDINEMGYYPYAVIEKRCEGLYGIDLDLEGTEDGAMWFRQKFLTFDEMKEVLKDYPLDWELRKRKDGSYEWDDIDGVGIHTSYNGYERCETPEWAKNTTGYTIG